MNINLKQWVTESRNAASENIDTLSTFEMLKIINEEDQKVAVAVEKEIAKIAQAVDVIACAFENEGRLVYLGAGTSGRLGVVDASECPPTFGTPPSLVVALIAGGKSAILKPVENAEDDACAGKSDLESIGFCARDVLVGIAASGRTPYVLGGMGYAKSLGAKVVSLACVPDCEMSHEADISICPVVGPEVITGSSRMKAGTAQKLVLNMLSTGSMIRFGKVYGNLMVDVEATNAKLRQRQINIVMEATGASAFDAQSALNASDHHCKTAIIMILLEIGVQDAKDRLLRHKGFMRGALKEK